MKDGETSEKYWDRFQLLIAKCTKENIKDMLFYLLSNLMINRAKEKGNLNDEEKQRLVDVIEETKGSDRVPKAEDEVISNLKQEFRRMKIENNRDEMTGKPIETHYGEDRSRYNQWQKFKNSRKFKDFSRSDSTGPGYWKNKKTGEIRQEFRRPRFYKDFSRDSSSRRRSSNGQATSYDRKSSSGRYDRSNSRQSRDSFQDPKLKERLTKVEEKLVNIEKDNEKKHKEIMELLQSKQNVGFVTEEDAIEDVMVDVTDVMFCRKVEKVEVMVVDTGCPKSLVGKEWLEKYMKKHNLKEQNLTRRNVGKDSGFDQVKFTGLKKKLRF